jgi:hypothetical protein
MPIRACTARALGALALAGLLAGCGGAGTRAVGEAPAPQVTIPKTSLATANLSNAEIYGQQAAAPIRQERQTAAIPSAVSPPAPSAAPPGADSPRKLAGFDRAAVQALLGAPSLQRPEGKAELWQYRAANCVLDVFFYTGKDGQMRVTHADLRGRRDNRAAPQGCYADIVAGGDKRAQTAETKAARN